MQPKGRQPLREFAFLDQPEFGWSHAFGRVSSHPTDLGPPPKPLSAAREVSVCCDAGSCWAVLQDSLGPGGNETILHSQDALCSL